eukprot:gene10179-12486_t
MDLSIVLVIRETEFIPFSTNFIDVIKGCIFLLRKLFKLVRNNMNLLADQGYTSSNRLQICYTTQQSSIRALVENIFARSSNWK